MRSHGSLIAIGVAPDTPVGICFERGVAMVVAIHAILAAVKATPIARQSC